MKTIDEVITRMPNSFQSLMPHKDIGKYNWTMKVQKSVLSTRHSSGIDLIGYHSEFRRHRKCFKTLCLKFLTAMMESKLS